MSYEWGKFWDVGSQPLPLNTFGDNIDIKEENIFAYYDGPLQFSFTDSKGQIFVAFLADMNDGYSRFLVTPFDDETKKQLESGKISTVHAWKNYPLWIIDIDGHGKVVGCWIGEFEKLPKEILPEKNVPYFFMTTEDLTEEKQNV